MIDFEHDARIHLDEAAIGIIGEALIAGLLGKSRDGFGLRPRLSTVSIMPGMEARAPERTETSSGRRRIAKASVREFADAHQRGLDRALSDRRDSAACYRRNRCRLRS